MRPRHVVIGVIALAAIAVPVADRFDIPKLGLAPEPTRAAAAPAPF